MPQCAVHSCVVGTGFLCRRLPIAPFCKDASGLLLKSLKSIGVEQDLKTDPVVFRCSRFNFITRNQDMEKDREPRTRKTSDVIVIKVTKTMTTPPYKSLQKPGTVTIRI